MNEVTVRYAIAADNVLLSEVGAQAFRDSFAQENTPENMAAYLATSFSPEKQAAELADPACTFFIAEIDGRTAGYAQLRSGPPPTCITGTRPVELVRIYAVKGWIGRGVGARLMWACIDEAQRKGGDTLWLGVWERNPRAIAFYRRWGFVEMGTHAFHLGADEQTDFLMQKRL